MGSLVRVWAATPGRRGVVKDPIQDVLFPTTNLVERLRLSQDETSRLRTVLEYSQNDCAYLVSELYCALEIQKTYADAYNELLEKRK